MTVSKDDRPVLAIYDIRGIQEFIFRSSRLKEIIGGSKLLENILMDSLKKAASGCSENSSPGSVHKAEDDLFLFDWRESCENEQEMLRFFEDSAIQMELLYEGGGNACALFRNNEICSRINREMAKIVMEDTYSLQLATAVVPVGDHFDYSEDYQNLQNELRRVKAEMPYSVRPGALPVMKRDALTGLPAVNKGGQNQYINKETELKLKAFEKIDKNQELEKEFDRMVLEKGKDSTIAIVHIDGNGMGEKIRDLLSRPQETSGNAQSDYSKAVSKVRKISKRITDAYNDTLNKVQKHCDLMYIKDGGKGLNPFRIVVSSGDDITFVCRGKYALNLAEAFCRDISVKQIWDSTEENALDRYGFSVCAGIAFLHSHFPFSIAYQVAEACCASAKKRAKQEKNSLYLDKQNHPQRRYIGNWLDFQICKSVQSSDFEAKREDDYRLTDGSWLLRRPYYVPVSTESIKRELDKQINDIDRDEKNSAPTMDDFRTAYLYFSDRDKIPSSLAKLLRNIYSQGADEMNLLLDFQKSRDRDFEKDLGRKAFENGIASWYDALEIDELYTDEETEDIE